MPSTNTLTPEQRFIGLFIGPKSSGKTVAACSFISSSEKRVKVLDFDGRIRGILGASWLDKYRERIDYDYYPPRVGLNQKHTYIRVNEDMELLLAQSSINQNPYGTLICDSLTSVTFAMMCDAIPLTHTESRGKKIGVLNMAGPEDYGFEATATYNLLAFFRSLPNMNIIVTAHVIDKYGKADPGNLFSENIIVGEKLSLRDKITANIGIYFDHIFRFDRRMVNKEEHFFVKFKGDIACTSFQGLSTGDYDITGKNFYEGLMKLVNTKSADQKGE